SGTRVAGYTPRAAESLMKRVCTAVLVFTVLNCHAPPDIAARGRIGGGRLSGIRSVPHRGFSGRGVPSRGISQMRSASRIPTASHVNRGSLNRSPSFTVPKASRSVSGISKLSGAGSRIGTGGAGLKRAGVTIPAGIGSRNIQPAARPQIGSSSHTGSGTRIGNSTRNINRSRAAQFPGLEHRPKVALPGLNGGAAARPLHNRFPGLNHDTLRQQIGAAGDSHAVTRDKFAAWREQQKTDRGRIPERRQNLQNRLSEIDREQWQEHRNDNRLERREDWQQHRNDAREDWQNWYDDRYYYHYGWYRGGWHYRWDRYWNRLWYEYPEAVAFGMTYWGVNAMAYSYGTMSYVNPYYTGASTGSPVDYSQPQITVEQTDGDDPATAPPEVPEQGLQLFEQARTAFHSGEYDRARQLADKALALMPHDALVHEFRALTFFAQQQYTGAATVLHSVLAVSPGWDWATMSQLYPDQNVYTAQLRALEDWTGKHPTLPDGHFVLAYHYLTCGHRDEAASQLKQVVTALPDDSISARLLNLLTGDPPNPSEASEPPPAADTGTAVLQTSQIAGKWTAAANSSTFGLELRQDGRFVWTYSQSGKTQSVAGVYAIDGATLAMEPDSGGVMLAQLLLQDSRLSFQQVGTNSILVFTRS
ncbi:MAG: tetratricopeptide repeat protein, partial [Planctomycetaceae bacterium]